jgi:predicted esterase
MMPSQHAIEVLKACAFFTLLFVLTHLSAFGKTNSEIFINEITYAICSGPQGEEIQLKADVYYQTSEENRPIIILCFGGNTDQMYKEADDIVFLAKQLAEAGYVAVSINYRTQFNFLGNPSREMYRAAFRGMEDCKMALAYFHQLALQENPFKTRNDAIYIGGVSIGGLLALESALVKTELDLNPEMQKALGEKEWQTLRSQIPIRGIISLCGGLTNLQNLRKNSNVSLCLIHGEKDKFIPIDSGVFNYQGLQTIPLYGAKTLDSLHRIQNGRSSFLSLQEASHVPWSNNAAYLDTCSDFILKFLDQDLKTLSVLEMQTIKSADIETYFSLNQLIIKGLNNHMTIKVFDSKGIEIANESPKYPLMKLDASFWMPGIYFVQISQNGLIEKRKLVLLSH